MRRKKNKTNIWLPLVAVGVFLAVSAGVYAFSHTLYAHHTVAEMPPELESAAIYETILQMLPEESPAHGALRIPIFIYHSVKATGPNDSDMQKSFEITPELLEEQLKYLHDNGYTPITLDEVALDLKNGTTSPIAKPVVLTFDDGWENQYIHAFPLLKKYGMVATFYVYPAAVGTKNFMTWDEINEMNAVGMDIEDHTLTHPQLRGMPLDEVKTQVTESKTILEQKLGKPVVHFASPYGYSNADIIRIVKDAGYVTYRTTYKGIYQDNPLRLRGIFVTDNFNYFVKELTR